MKHIFIIVCITIILIICIINSRVVVEHLKSGCVEKNSLGRCKQCLDSNQCKKGMYCCPYMKKCITSSNTSCFYPIANCDPPCPTINNCNCKPTNNTSFPDGWQSPTCTGDEGNSSSSNTNTSNSESSVPSAGSNSSGSNESIPSSINSFSLISPSESEYKFNCSCNLESSESSNSESNTSEEINSVSNTDSSWAQRILNNSNNIREQCSSSIPKLEWDSDLASYAENYAQTLATKNNCDLSHTFDGHNSYSQMGAGENLYMSGGYGMTNNSTTRKKIADGAVNGWAGEGYSGSGNFEYSQGHYTAMNWSNTTKIGCGYGFGNGCAVVSCNYKDVAPNSAPSGQYNNYVLCTSPFSIKN